MDTLVEWLRSQPGAGLGQHSFNVASLYATAFEFTAIGAWCTETAAALISARWAPAGANGSGCCPQAAGVEDVRQMAFGVTAQPVGKKAVSAGSTMVNLLTLATSPASGALPTLFVIPERFPGLP